MRCHCSLFIKLFSSILRQRTDGYNFHAFQIWRYSSKQVFYSRGKCSQKNNHRAISECLVSVTWYMLSNTIPGNTYEGISRNNLVVWSPPTQNIRLVWKRSWHKYSWLVLEILGKRNRRRRHFVCSRQDANDSNFDRISRTTRCREYYKSVLNGCWLPCLWYLFSATLYSRTGHSSRATIVWLACIVWIEPSWYNCNGPVKHEPEYTKGRLFYFV